MNNYNPNERDAMFQKGFAAGAKSLREFVEFALDKWESESEYGGRMETWCFYCGEYQEPRQPETHKKDCLHVKAKELLKGNPAP